jgi:ABC-type molybdenum transport system ATPase subunit/photorepair protein PhrA
VRGSGKTTMLTVLTQELTTTVARRFRASIDAVGN